MLLHANGEQFHVSSFFYRNPATLIFLCLGDDDEEIEVVLDYSVAVVSFRSAPVDTPEAKNFGFDLNKTDTRQNDQPK